MISKNIQSNSIKPKTLHMEEASSVRMGANVLPKHADQAMRGVTLIILAVITFTLLVVSQTTYGAQKNKDAKSFGGEKQYSETKYYADKKSHAISGYDTVAYFTQNEAVQGSSEYPLEWDGVTWLFASAENRTLFEENPEMYIPQYGGYCAWAVGEKGKLYKTDPTVWNIVDGKLYLNYNKKINNKWAKDQDGFIEKGNLLWQKITGT